MRELAVRTGREGEGACCEDTSSVLLRSRDYILILLLLLVIYL